MKDPWEHAKEQEVSGTSKSIGRILFLKILKQFLPYEKVGLLYSWLLDEHIPFCLSHFHRKHTGC